MKNITRTIDGETLAQGREYPKRRNMSFNALVRDIPARTVKSASGMRSNSLKVDVWE